MKLIYRILLILIFISVQLEVFSQGPIQSNPEEPGCFPPPCVPVSDHIGWLIGAMIIFGIVKSIQFSRRSSKV